VRVNLDFRLLDTLAENDPNLTFALDDAAQTVARLRDAGQADLAALRGRSEPDSSRPCRT
jgi:hypothetical protein